MGNTEDVRHAISTMKSPALRKFMKYSMFANIIGDIVPTLLVGQGIYRGKLDELAAMGWDRDAQDTKDEAMSYLFQVVDSTQQSGKLEDQANWQRSYGSLGKAFSIFTNTTRQYLEKEFDAIMNLRANNSKENRQKMGRVIAINHVFLPLAYNGMNLFYNMLLGDDLDDDDYMLMLKSMVAGPISGYIVFGAIATTMSDKLITGEDNRYKSMTPLQGILNDAENVMGVMHNVGAGDIQEAWNDAWQVIRSNVAPAREINKAIDNYND